MTTELAIFNRALIAMSERSLASLTEPREPQRILSSVWSDCVQFCLEAGVWNFALRTAALSSAGAGSMNYSNAFNKPSDFIHLFTASLASNFEPPLVMDFVDQGTQLMANGTTLYVRYTSNDATVGGGNLSLWTQTFATYVAQVLASWTALRITGKPDVADDMERRVQIYLLRALAIDSVASLPGLRPFNAEARGLPVEGHQPFPLDMAPFHPGMFARDSGGGGGRGGPRGG
jgi:hypothetical protein